MTRTRRAFGSIRKLPSGRHQASYRGPDGRRHLAWTTYLRRSDAEAWLRDEELLTDRPETWTPPSRRNPVQQGSPLTFAEYAEANLRRRATRSRAPLKPTTFDNYEKLLCLAILPDLGSLRLVDLTPERLARWHAALPDRTPTQNGNAYQLLHSLLRDAADEGLLEKAPARIKGAGKPTPKREGVALNAGEMAVWAATVERHALPLLLAAWCSLRSGEVRGLRRRDVAADGTLVTVAQAVSRVGKGSQRRWHFDTPKTAAGRRVVAVPPHLAPMLCDWIEAHPGDPDGLLFPATDGVTPLGADQLLRAHKTAAKAAGHPDMTVHDLRRTGATLAGQSGATIRELMRRLGHTTPGVAMIYQRADDDRDRAVAQRMSELR